MTGRALVAAAALLVGGVASAMGQQASEPGTRLALTGPASSQPVVNFDTPEFRAALQRAAADSGAPEHGEAPAIADWRVLLERAEQFRGRVVQVEGVVGRNTAWRFTEGPEQELGALRQVELRDAGQAVACTLIFTQAAEMEIPIGARLEARGEFVLVRAYVADSGATRYAPLLVGTRPVRVTPAGAHAAREPAASDASVLLLIGAGTLGLVAAWWILRARLARARPEVGEASVQPAPASLASELAAWANADDPQRDAAGSDAAPGKSMGATDE